MAQVAIVDSGGANIASIRFALERLGVKAVLSSNADVIRNADRVLLPGVGAARSAMSRLQEAKLIDVIRGLRQPVLGVCLGMQLLCDGSEEEDVECLGIIPGTARKLPSAVDNPVPNMGWCATNIATQHPVLLGLGSGDFFYYLHSYAIAVSEFTLATATHQEPFSAIIARRNYVAAQFHPERSSVAGALLLRNFLGRSVCD